MSQDLPTTSYALLGLLTFGDDLTGYELKQRADRTLRFYWVSPAMSQVYTELARLADRDLVSARDAGPNKRSSKYRITAKGRRELTAWLESEPVEFPTLKHPVALRLLIGHLVDPATTTGLLRDYLAALAKRRAQLATTWTNPSTTPRWSPSGAWSTSTASARSSRSCFGDSKTSIETRIWPVASYHRPHRSYGRPQPMKVLHIGRTPTSVSFALRSFGMCQLLSIVRSNE
jgi:DNA-binding PadR family transcriptional regulator